MSHQTEPTTQVARQRHQCSWCGQRINPGEVYERHRYFDGGEAGTVKMHPECAVAMREEARLEGGWIEWGYGDGERPTTEGTQP